MKLLTKEILKKLPAIGTTEKQADPLAQVKFFNPMGAGTWYATEFDGKDLFFGKAIIHESELGYFSLSELQTLRLPLGMKIERDLYFDPKPLSECK